MGLKPRFTANDIRAKLEADTQKILKVIVARLQYLGEECVNMARSLDTYKDRTGNLRNSIGYIVALNGSVVKTNFKKSAVTAATDKQGNATFDRGSKNGVKVGKDLALSLLTGSKTKGAVLIVVAGMEYAEKVEALNYDVLTSAELYAKKELPGLIKQIQARVKTTK